MSSDDRLHCLVRTSRDWKVPLKTYRAALPRNNLYWGRRSADSCWVAIPEKNPRSTIVGNLWITGCRIINGSENTGRKAFACHAVVLFDWRAHGKTALLFPT